MTGSDKLRLKDIKLTPSEVQSNGIQQKNDIIGHQTLAV